VQQLFLKEFNKMIKCEEKDGILKIEFSRPEKRNAFTVKMYRDLKDTLIAGDLNSEVKVILMHGAGDTFSAGNDLQDFLSSPILSEDAPALQLLRTIALLKKPLIAAVNGSAVGIGATMLFHCDLVYAQKEAKFIFPFVSLGLVPEAAVSLLMPRLIGHQRSSEILFFGEALSAEQAYQSGFVNKVISDHSSLDYAIQQALRLTALSQEALVKTKSLLKGNQIQADVISQINSEGRVLIERLKSTSFKEALSAFVEKRKPDYRGLD
jgi:enoyl-CoA hydratase/carnithine racemase